MITNIFIFNQALREDFLLQDITMELESLVEDFNHLEYLSDNFSMAMQNVKDAMAEIDAGYEEMKRA